MKPQINKQANKQTKPYHFYQISVGVLQQYLRQTPGKHVFFFNESQWL